MSRRKYERMLVRKGRLSSPREPSRPSLTACSSSLCTMSFTPFPLGCSQITTKRRSR